MHPSGISPISALLPLSTLIPPRGSTADERQAAAARAQAPGRKRRSTTESTEDTEIPAASLCVLCGGLVEQERFLYF